MGIKLAPTNASQGEPMSTFDDYKDRYKTIRLERRDGILQMTLHSRGAELIWGGLPHRELAHAFHEIGRDRGNKVVIMTGTGAAFSGPRPDPAARAATMPQTPAGLDEIMSEGKRLLANLLDIEVPVIAAVNGPAWRHSELPLLSDIVLAAEEASFQDSGHFTGGLVPGDGVHVVYPLLLGLNRARYFLITGQEIGRRRRRSSVSSPRCCRATSCSRAPGSMPRRWRDSRRSCCATRARCSPRC